MIEHMFRVLVFIWDTPSSIEVKHIFIYMSEKWEEMHPCSYLWTSKNTFDDLPYAKLEEIYFLMCLSQRIFVCWFSFPWLPLVKEEMKDWFSRV